MPPTSPENDLFEQLKEAINLPGRDAFGSFRVIAERCGLCDLMAICAAYEPDSCEIEGINVEATILGDWRCPIGVTCGCYAKLHRQVAHIHDEHRRRGR